MSEELQRDAEIRNTKGLHARAAAKFCKTAGQFDAEVQVAAQRQPRFRAARSWA